MTYAPLFTPRADNGLTGIYIDKNGHYFKGFSEDMPIDHYAVYTTPQLQFPHLVLEFAVALRTMLSTKA